MKFDLFRSRQGEQGFQIEDKQNADLAGHFPQNCSFFSFGFYKCFLALESDPR